MTKNNKNQSAYTKSELFSVMNRLRAQGYSNKEAYAEAKAQLDKKYSVTGTFELTADHMKQMRQGYVKLTFINRHGKEITTTATLDFSRVPTTRKVEGSQKPKSSNHVVFYDGRHGVYRQCDKAKVVAIQ